MTVAETSIQANDSLRPKVKQTQEQRIVELLADGAELTREQIARALGLKEASVCARCDSLLTKKAIEQVDGGRTSTGRRAMLLRIPKPGQQALFH